MNRYSRSTLARVAVVAGLVTARTVTVRADTLRAFGTTLHRVEPLLFRRADTGSLVAFRADSTGRVSHLFAENAPYAAFERVSWFDGATAHLTVLGGSLVVLLTAFVVGPLAWSRRGVRARAGSSPSHVSDASARDYSRATLVLVLATAGVGIAIVIAFGVLLARTDTWQLQYGLTPPVRAAVVGALLVPALGLLLAGRVGMAWKRGEWGTPVRVHHTLAAAAALGVALFLFYWRLLAFRV